MRESWLNPNARNDYDMSDTSEDEDESNLLLGRDPLTRDIWQDKYFDAISELYMSFKTTGESLFGKAFFQFGTQEQFVHFVYKNTVELSNPRNQIS